MGVFFMSEVPLQGMGFKVLGAVQALVGAVLARVLRQYGAGLPRVVRR